MKKDMLYGQAHKITDNVFSHIYCIGGCAAEVNGSYRMQLYFARNKYEYMVSLDGGSIYESKTGNEEVKGGNLVTSFWNEKVNFSFGKTAIRIMSHNEALTFINGSTFQNCFALVVGSI
jgi:hypothetical protein